MCHHRRIQVPRDRTGNVTFVENLGTLIRRLAVIEPVGGRPAQQVFFGEFHATGWAAV